MIPTVIQGYGVPAARAVGASEDKINPAPRHEHVHDTMLHLTGVWHDFKFAGPVVEGDPRIITVTAATTSSSNTAAAIVIIAVLVVLNQAQRVMAAWSYGARPFIDLGVGQERIEVGGIPGVKQSHETEGLPLARGWRRAGGAAPRAKGAAVPMARRRHKTCPVRARSIRRRSRFQFRIRPP